MEPTLLTERDYPHIRTHPEKEMLEGMLDWCREGCLIKARGLTDEQAAQRLVSSETTVVGLMKHLAFAEGIWFVQLLTGAEMPEPFAGPLAAERTDTFDWPFTSAVEDGLAASIALYEEACARSREIAAQYDLEYVSPHGRMPFNLRYAYHHMIVETSRHLGHLDILREQIDGGVGN